MNRVNKKLYFSIFVKIIMSVLIPFLVSALFLFLGEKQFLTNIMPSHNDEDFYYHQIKAILEYGQPLGYYGYDGSHAFIGRFGFHGFIILAPYVIVSAIFGLGYNTIAIVNIGLIALTCIVFVYLYNPSYLRLIWFCIFILSPMLLYFINTNMVEGENYFFAIISALLMVHLAKKNSKSVKIALGFVIIWAVLSKVTWTILVFPYMFLLINEKKVSLQTKFVIPGLATILSGIAGYSIFLLFRADYFKHMSQIELIIDSVKENGLSKGMIDSFAMIIENISITWLSIEKPWLGICKIFVIIIGMLALWFFITYCRKDITAFIPLFVILGFTLGVAVLYAGGQAAVRTVYPAAVFVQIYLFLFVEKKSKLKRILYIVSTVFFFLAFGIKLTCGYDARSYYDDGQREYYQSLQDYMGNIELEENASDPWNNTLALVWDSYPDRIYELFIPEGTGLNFYWDIPEELSELYPAYILLANHNLEDVERLEKGGYTVLAKDDQTTLMSNKTK